jgi:Flp pilus assembly protein TadD, contains TPR repeats
MLYGIRARIVVVVFFVPLCGTFLIGQAPDHENLSVEISQQEKIDSLAIPLDIIKKGSVADTSETKTRAPSDAIDYNNLAVNYAKQKLYDDALRNFRRAIELDPKFRSAYINLSSLFDLMGRPEDALDTLHKAREIGPPMTSEQIEECELLLFLNRNEESVKCYQVMMKTDQLDLTSEVNHGIGLMRLNRWAEAEEIMERVTPQIQQNAKMLNALGMARYRTKKYKAAIDAFKQAVEIDPDQRNIRFNLGIAQLADRNKPGALSQYKMLAESDPDLAQKLYRIIYSDKLVFVQDK